MVQAHGRTCDSNTNRRAMGDYSGTIGRSFQNAVTQASIARISVPKETAVIARPCVKLGLFSHSVK